MDTRTVAAVTNSRVHHTVFISLTLPPKHFMNFVLSCTTINNLEHTWHYIWSQTTLDPTVSSTNLPTVLHHKCVPPLCDHPVNTHVQSSTTLQCASTAYETLDFSWVSLCLYFQHIMLVPHYIFHWVLQADILTKAAFWPPHWVQ